MSFAGSIDAPFEIIGGLVCDEAPEVLPLGVSPDCQDMAFSQSAPQTRPGLTSIFTAISGNPTVNYIKTYENLQEVLATLVFDSAGNLWAENSVGVLTSLATAIAYQSPYANSTTEFGREYMAFGDGKIGQDIPRQYDGTNLDRVSQIGPGPWGPSSIASLPITAISRSGSTVTVTTSKPIGAITGGQVIVSGVADSIFNQAGAVQSISGNQFTLTQSGWGPFTLTQVAVSGGNATYTGTIAAGASNFFAGYIFIISGFSTGGNNVTITVTASTTTTLVCVASTQVNETHAGTATQNASSSGGTATPVAVISDIIATISAISRTSNVVEVTTAAATGMLPTDQVIIAGVTDSSYDGVFPILSIIDSLHFTYAQTAANSSSSGGAAAPAGSVSAGVHQCVAMFVTRQGYITKPSPPTSWTSVGGCRVNVTGIPSPATLPNVVARILAFTTAAGEQFFYTTGLLGAPQMQVFDNNLSSFVVDVSDAQLTGGTDATELFNLVELGECAGVVGYAERMFWWGERNKQPNWDNLTFDGGFGGLAGFVPLGWTPDGTYFGGGSYDTGGFAIWGADYRILGDGSTAKCGLITQSGLADYLGTARIDPNTAYSARVCLRMIGALTQGTFHLNLHSTSLSLTSTGVSVAFSQVTAGAWKEFIAPICTAGQFAIASDLLLQVYVDGTPTNSAGFLVDNIEIFPTLQPYNGSLVRASLAEDPESYDGVTGFMNIAENNGQAVRAGFELRGNLYLVKERSMFSTSDNGQEPNTWDVAQVSATVGTPSVRGVAVGEDWAVIAGRSGLFIFSGGEPWKISQEVSHSAAGLTLAWDQINWAYGHTLWTAVDTVKRRILVGAPFGAATSPNYVLQLDYRDVDGGAEAIAQAPPIVVSYRGVKIVKDKSRKWSPWTISANCGAAVERFDGTQQIFLGCGAYGNQASSGKVYQVDETNLTDDGAAIPSYYVTGYTPQRDTEQTLQIHAHRKLFYYLSLFVEGKGYLNVTACPLSESNPQLCAQLRMASPATKDLETSINPLGERVAFKMAPDATVAGNWFRLSKICVSMNGDPWSPVRGQN